MHKILSNGKALYIDEDTIYIAKGYNIYRLEKDGEHCILDGKIIDSRYRFMSHFSRLLNRLLRLEASNMLLLKNGSRLLSAKKGIFLAKKGSKQYIKLFSFPRGNKPLNIAIDGEGILYFGEYFLNGKFKDKERAEVHIYQSKDNGESWKICYTFPKNSIRHIHGIFFDNYTNRLWVTTGDRDNESMIAFTSDKFKSLEIVKKGEQKYRAVTLLFYQNYMVYGTDTEHEKNYIYSIDRESLEERRLQEVQGSVLMAIQKGNLSLLSTAVEPSKVNNHTSSHIWLSKDGKEWRDVYSEQKDIWSAKYFQYGRVTFPYNGLSKRSIVFSGHALKKIDNRLSRLFF